MKITGNAVLQNFGSRLIDVSAKRNNAAHGTAIISFSDAQTAKEDTFIIDENSAEDCRGMVIEFLKYLK